MPKKKRHPIDYGWQQRTMTPAFFKAVIKEMELSKAAMSRFLGVSYRTAARYALGTTPIPAAHSLLLRAMLTLGEKPIVPPWTRDPNKGPN